MGSPEVAWLRLWGKAGCRPEWGRWVLGAIVSDSSRSAAVHFDGVTPILMVRDLAASLEFYVDKLGFTKDWDWGDPPGFASVSRGKVCLFLSQGSQGQAGMWLSIFVDDVDGLYEVYRGRGVTIRQPPTDFEWGMREMNVEDPDGHRLRIGSMSTVSTDNIDLVDG